MSLIHLNNIAKVFLTDEVETRALSGIELSIESGEYTFDHWPFGFSFYWQL
jgi:putative ABC transport system ATP-binding protein